MMDSKVAAVILSYNNTLDTIACVRSVAESNWPLLAIYVVDNGSRPEVVSELKEHLLKFPSAKLICATQNLGFAAGMNLGIKEALAGGANYILILNNDTVLERDAVAELVRGVNGAPHAAIAAPKILYYHDKSTLWFAGSNKSFPYPKHRGMGQKDQSQFDTLREISFATGCAMLVKTEILEELGLLDERFFFGMEDREFSLRCLRRGLKILYVPSSIIYHKVGLTRKGNVDFNKAYLGYLSQLFFIRITKNKLSWVGLFLIYGIYLALLLPLRTALTSGPTGWLATWRAALAAWSRAWHAERAWPLE